MNQPTTKTLSDRARPTRLVCRLLNDPPASGAWNMAVDEALLAAAAEESTVTLRFYQWDEPTLSLGYFQRNEDREQHAASRGAAVVRRPSGGGAILHDRELTYSLVLPASHPLARHADQLYFQVHEAVIGLLTSMLRRNKTGWEFQLCDGSVNLPPSDEPFLCFQRRSRGDVLLRGPAEHGSKPPVGSGWKILGSAQRRHRGAILQHGSLLVERSPAAAELPGLRDLTGVAVTVERLAAALPATLGGVLSAEVQQSRLSPALRSAAEQLEQTKYASPAWTKRR